MSENINFINDDVMKYVTGSLQWKLPRAPLPFNPSLVGCKLPQNVRGCLTDQMIPSVTL